MCPNRRPIMLCYVPCYCSLELTLRCMGVGDARWVQRIMGWQRQHSYTKRWLAVGLVTFSQLITCWSKIYGTTQTCSCTNPQPCNSSEISPPAVTVDLSITVRPSLARSIHPARTPPNATYRNTPGIKGMVHNVALPRRGHTVMWWHYKN